MLWGSSPHKRVTGMSRLFSLFLCNKVSSLKRQPFVTSQFRRSEVGVGSVTSLAPAELSSYGGCLSRPFRVLVGCTS